MASDADIIHAVVQGDVDRYAELVDKYQGPAFRLAFSLVGNVEDAKDVFQEAFVNAYRALGQFRGGAKFSTWLYRIVVNECKDTYKQRARHPMVAAGVGGSDSGSDDGTLFVDVQDPTPNPRDHAANRELSRQISGTIQALPMKQRTAFALHHLHGLTLDEVAAVMRCRVGTVKSHIFRATEQLRVHLRPWLAEEARSWSS
jgi:RNA polymerase sigma-70 factor (ECF subfamily)